MNFKSISEEAILKHIGESMRGARVASNLTLEELSKKSEINPTTLSKIENGKTNTTILVLIRIFTSLGREKEIEKLFPEPSASPILMSRYEKKAPKIPQRVRKGKKKKTEWTWED
ncbi:MAG: helix-turn-helix domain-containing protein [Xanthomonadales bacterium]|nr:helix-turn-helix domain-containing protein [Xanthomonadales bacterium]